MWGVILLVLVVGVCSHQEANFGFTLIESIPVGLVIEPVVDTTYQVWLPIMSNATKTLRIAGMYSTLTQGTSFPPEAEGYMGQEIFNAIINAHKRGVQVQIVLAPASGDPEWSEDVIKYFAAGIDVRFINWEAVTNSSAGILHTKLMVIDSNYAYVGSANWDWRSIAHTKELGVVTSIPSLVQDIEKIFDIYWLTANQTEMPHIPSGWDTNYNLTNPDNINVNGETSFAYIASSPPLFNTPSRTGDIDALIHAIDSAEQFVYGSVMDYSPITLYFPKGQGFYWGVLDDAWRRAAYRGIEVHLLFSIWEYTDTKLLQYLRSLDCIDNITVNVMIIPAWPGGPIPYSRVNHSKYVVTDKLAYITTSNWTPDYFLQTGGVSISFALLLERQQVVEVFQRDWNSPYTTPIKYLPFF